MSATNGSSVMLAEDSTTSLIVWIREKYINSTIPRSLIYRRLECLRGYDGTASKAFGFIHDCKTKAQKFGD